MPAKNAIKIYVKGGFYHIYNRGVNKRTIFVEDKDYKIFLSYLKTYLTPAVTQTLQGDSLKFVCFPSRQLKNYCGLIKLVAYKLMPNHFHLLLQQSEPQTVAHFMRSLITKYVKCFNTRYQRVGPLFQGTYKGVLIESTDQLVYTSKYIHRNGYTPTRSLLEVSRHSSYPNYLGMIRQTWVDPSPVLSQFYKLHPDKDYQRFVEDVDDNEFSRAMSDISLDGDFKETP